MKYPGAIGRVQELAEGLLASLRRREESRAPRVRFRLAHGEAKVLPKASPEEERLLTIASELVSEYERPDRGV